MKAVVFHGTDDIRLEDVPDPRVEQPSDAVVTLTASAVCGTDLHMVRGTMPGMKPGVVLGHEGVGVVEEVGAEVRNFVPGDRVVIASTVGCGSCSYCRAGYYAQCDVANPGGPLAGTVFFGGPESTGSLNGMQAERVRVPYANVTLVKLPEEVPDDDALLLSDIVPTAWSGRTWPRSAPATPSRCSGPVRSGCSPSCARTSRAPDASSSSTVSPTG